MNRRTRIALLTLSAILLATLAFAQTTSKRLTGRANKQGAPAAEAPRVEQPLDSFEFSFYYQRIDEVIPVRSGTPAAAVAAVREFVSGAKRVPVSSLRKRLLKVDLTQEGRQEVRSDDNQTRYKMFVTKVRDEAHLLQLMGVATDTGRLTDGQRGLLAAYRKAKEQALLDRMRQGCRDKVEIVLTDTNGHDSESVLRDFWPYSNGKLIQLNSMRYNNPDGEEDARSTLVHEAAHSMDRTQIERDFPYGPDGMHYINEASKPRASFVEGWAEFLQMHDSPDLASWWPKVFEDVKIERAKGVYDTASASAVDGMTLTRVEGINALVMLEVSKLPGGMENMYLSFRATNKDDRTLSDFLTDYVVRNPDQASSVAQIFDTCTRGKLTDDQMRHFLGTAAGVNGYLQARQAAADAAARAAARANISSSTPDMAEHDPATSGAQPAGQEVEVRSGNQKNPFTIEQQKKIE